MGIDVLNPGRDRTSSKMLRISFLLATTAALASFSTVATAQDKLSLDVYYESVPRQLEVSSQPIGSPIRHHIHLRRRPPRSLRKGSLPGEEGRRLYVRLPARTAGVPREYHSRVRDRVQHQ